MSDIPLVGDDEPVTEPPAEAPAAPGDWVAPDLPPGPAWRRSIGPTLLATVIIAALSAGYLALSGPLYSTPAGMAIEYFIGAGVIVLAVVTLSQLVTRSLVVAFLLLACAYPVIQFLPAFFVSGDPTTTAKWISFTGVATIVLAASLLLNNYVYLRLAAANAREAKNRLMLIGMAYYFVIGTAFTMLLIFGWNF